jgi:hypothetical protein
MQNILRVVSSRKRLLFIFLILILLDPKSGKPTRIGRKLKAEGKLVRYAKKSGEEIK